MQNYNCRRPRAEEGTTMGLVEIVQNRIRGTAKEEEKKKEKIMIHSALKLFVLYQSQDSYMQSGHPPELIGKGKR